MLVPAKGSRESNDSLGTGGLEVKVDANGVEDEEDRLGGENGFAFAAAGSASRSCTVGVDRLIIEVGSAGFVLDRRRGVTGVTGCKGRWRYILAIAASSSLLSAFHFLYLSAAKCESK